MFPVARGLSSFVSMIAPSIGIVHAQTAPSEGDLDLNIELHDALPSDRSDELPSGGRLGHASLSQRITETHSSLATRGTQNPSPSMAFDQIVKPPSEFDNMKCFVFDRDVTKHLSRLIRKLDFKSLPYRSLTELN